MAWYYLWAALLTVGNCCAWLLNLFALPGNWVIVGLTALFAFLLPYEPGGRGISWWTVGALVLIALLGEVIEFAAGAAGAAKQGGSRRGMVLAIVGTMAGSIAGAFVSLPVPIIGPILGALGGGALGAFVGAWLGETWKGRTSAERMEISKGALIGRLLGTIGKLWIGMVMVVIATVSAFF